ncbi:MAG TPA: hypothetical protein VGI29_06815, partial [Candidatus Binataceae bacterium]
MEALSKPVESAHGSVLQPRSLLARYLIYGLPALAAAWFIWHYGVNVPFLDDWIVPGDIRSASTFKGFIQALFRGDNDHALLIPKLVFFSLAYLTHWNIKIGMLAVLLSSVITFFAIVRLAESETQTTSWWRVPLALLLSALLMFSFVHYDTWLHDWQLTHDMGDMFVVLAIAFITLSRSVPS